MQILNAKFSEPYNLYIISSLFVNIYTFVLILLIFLLLIVLIFDTSQST